jgi:hypothetical protein
MSEYKNALYDPSYLPTSRRKFIIDNPVTKMADLQDYRHTRICPQWNKVSKTAFEGRANLCGGYGRRIQNTTISSDCPTYFLNPDRVLQPITRLDSARLNITIYLCIIYIYICIYIYIYVYVYIIIYLHELMCIDN